MHLTWGEDGLHVSTVQTSKLAIEDMMGEPREMPPGGFVIKENAAEIKKVVDVPVIAVGRINDVEIAESVLQADKADLVTMARASLIKETN